MTDVQASLKMTIANAIQWAVSALKTVSDDARLEVEVLLAHTLNAERSHLHAWPDRLLNDAEINHFHVQVNRRLSGEPVAYVIGKREFWSLNLMVTPDTLIPRQETELLVEVLLQKLNDEEIKTVADLGTGSGAIGLALGHERPAWVIHATDRMPAALQVAKQNAQNLGIANIKFHEGSWCSALPNFQFDAIVSNPPYIAEGDTDLHQDVLKTEPFSALFSGLDGLKDIKQIINEAKARLKSGAYLLLEHGHRQAEAVRLLLKEAGYQEIESFQDLTGIYRATIGRFNRLSIAS